MKYNPQCLHGVLRCVLGGVGCLRPSLLAQYYQTAEDLGLYGQDPTATASKGVFVATGAGRKQSTNEVELHNSCDPVPGAPLAHMLWLTCTMCLSL